MEKKKFSVSIFSSIIIIRNSFSLCSPYSHKLSTNYTAAQLTTQQPPNPSTPFILKLALMDKENLDDDPKSSGK